MSFPMVKILGISGGGQGMNTRLGLRLTEFLGAVQQLEKPFTREQVLETVHRLL